MAALAWEVRDVVRRAVDPRRPPTGDELHEQLPAVANLVCEISESEGLTDEEALALLEAYVSHVLAIRISERFSSILAEGDPPRRPERRYGHVERWLGI